MARYDNFPKRDKRIKAYGGELRIEGDTIYAYLANATKPFFSVPLYDGMNPDRAWRIAINQLRATRRLQPLPLRCQSCNNDVWDNAEFCSTECESRYAKRYGDLIDRFDIPFEYLPKSVQRRRVERMIRRREQQDDAFYDQFTERDIYGTGKENKYFGAWTFAQKAKRVKEIINERLARERKRK